MRRSIVGPGAAALFASVSFATPASIGFDAPIRLATRGGAQDVAVADVTGDGLNDVVACSSRYDGDTIRVFRGHGDGTFDAPVDTQVPAGGLLMRVRTARIDSDSASDLVLVRVADYMTVQIDVLRADGAGGFTLSERLVPRDVTYPAFDFAFDGVPCDWNGDGATDVVAMTLEGSVRTYLNDGQGRFPSFETVVWWRGSFLGENGLVVADLDADGRPDFGAPAFGGVQVYWRLADGSLVYGEALKSAQALWPVGDLLAEDLDGDGLRDFAMATVDAYRKPFVAVFLHSGARTFAPAVMYSPPSTANPSAPSGLAAADLDGDGRLDLVSSNGILMNDGAGGFGTSIPLPVGGLPAVAVGSLSAVAVGNLDADARPDVVAFDGATEVVVMPVRSSSPAPYVASVEPRTLTYGRLQAVVLRGSGFAATDTVDFGAGTYTGGMGLTGVFSATDSEIVVVVQTYVSFSPGERLVTVTSPGGAVGRAPFAFASVSAPPLVARAVDGLTPDHARPGETLDVVVRGKGLSDAQTVWLGWDVHVNSATVLGDDRFMVNLTVSPIAEIGRRDVTVGSDTGEMHVETTTRSLFEIAPPRSLTLRPTAGRLVPGVCPPRGALTVSGSIAFNSFSPDRAFVPATEGATIRFGDLAAPSEIVIPAADPGWRLRGKRATWHSPRRSLPHVKLVLDFAKHTFRLAVARASLAPLPSDQILLEITLGDETGTSTQPWAAGRRRKTLILR